MTGAPYYVAVKDDPRAGLVHYSAADHLWHAAELARRDRRVCD